MQTGNNQDRLMTRKTIDAPLSWLLVLYSLFLFSGVYEQSRLLSWLPDLTAVFGFAVVVGLTYYVLWYRDGCVVIEYHSIIAGSMFVLFAFWLALSLQWAPQTIYGIMKVVRFVVGSVLLFVFPLVVVGSSETRRHTLNVMIIAFGMFIAIITVATSGIPLNIPALSVAAQPVALAVIGIVVYLLFSEKVQIGAALFVTGVGTAALVQIGSRTPFFATVLVLTGYVLVWLLSTNQLNPRQRLWTVGNIGTILIGLVWLTIFADTALARRVKPLLQGGGASLNFRLRWWQQSIDTWLSDGSSYFIGKGAGAFAAMEIKSYADVVYPHNIIMEIVLETGLIGLILFILIVAYSTNHLPLTDPLQLPPTVQVCLAWFVFSLINSMLTGDIYMQKYLYVSLGILAAYSKQISSK